jgi:hypothetical protein
MNSLVFLSSKAKPVAYKNKQRKQSDQDNVRLRRPHAARFFAAAACVSAGFGRY